MVASAGAVAACGSSSDNGNGSGGGNVKSATAITKVYGAGQKFIAVALEYDTAIDSAKLTKAAFQVAGRTVITVYANTSATLASTGANGKYVIVELSPDDSSALLWGDPGSTGTPMNGASSGAPDSAQPSGGTQSGGGQPSGGGGPQAGATAGPANIKTAAGTVTQTAAITTTAGDSIAASSDTIRTSKTTNLIVDDFQQFTFKDAKTGQTLEYNLYIPENYDKSKSYPMVLFMHDASVVSTTVKAPLVQGLGAVCWASPEDQAKREAFVLAPSYPSVVIGDDYKPTKLFDATANLVQELTTQYSIDTNRLYTTGQSMGAMMSLGLNIKYPSLFAAAYIVAGQWPASQATPLAKKKLWVTVSQGDTKAYPGEQAIMAVVEKAGTKVSTATWNGKATAAQFAIDVKAMEAKDTPINFSSFIKGSTLPTGSTSTAGGSEHTTTWLVAYTIDGIRDWIFQQSK